MENNKEKYTHFNYRVLYHNDEFEDYVSVHNVYYSGDTPVAYGDIPVPPVGSDLKELQSFIRFTEEALQKPILYAGERFPEEYKPEQV